MRRAGPAADVAWAAPADGAAKLGKVAYALDGGVFAAGALLDWLARDLGLARRRRRPRGGRRGRRATAPA